MPRKVPESLYFKMQAIRHSLRRRIEWPAGDRLALDRCWMRLAEALYHRHIRFDAHERLSEAAHMAEYGRCPLSVLAALRDLEADQNRQPLYHSSRPASEARRHG
jgi:hypothetical protein